MTLHKYITKAVTKHSIPEEFSDAAINQAQAMTAPTASDIVGREDLRSIPLVTIDGDDSKDFDDAVFAEPWHTGFHLIVAIADVAHYVTQQSALDIEALERGNSVYFPTKCIPMLPEELSNNLCSLRPNEDRLALAIHLYIDEDGTLMDSKVVAAVINSHARLTYQNVQKFLDGDLTAIAAGVQTSVGHLFGAYKARLINRENRFTADYDSLEKFFVFKGKRVLEVKPAARYESQKLIEEAMILANKAVAKTLIEAGSLCVSRTHSAPTDSKLQRLHALAKEYNLGRVPDDITPEVIWNMVQGVPEDLRPAFKKLLLQTSQKAIYSCEDSGHFGLALEYYAHFTSPIRRYSDLVIHRLLYTTLKLPTWEKIGAMPTRDELNDICAHISATEVKAQRACYDVNDQLTAEYYKPKVDGQVFQGTILTIQKKRGQNGKAKPSNLSVLIDDGLARVDIPLGNTPGNRYKLTRDGKTLICENSNTKLVAGDTISVVLTSVSIEKAEIKGKLKGQGKNNNHRNKKSGVKCYKNQIGKNVDGTIVEMKPHGMLISFDDGKAQALLPLSFLKEDHYVLNASKGIYKGRKTKKVYKVGETLQVKLVKVCSRTAKMTVDRA
tara:strand:- start:204299 stop:206131 length:1833 start_codon:yes stop_codon:yes gene_type:complete